MITLLRLVYMGDVFHEAARSRVFSLSRFLFVLTQHFLEHRTIHSVMVEKPSRKPEMGNIVVLVIFCYDVLLLVSDVPF